MTSDQPSGDDDTDIEYKKTALKNAIICLGWIKLTSVALYIYLYYMVRIYSYSNLATALQIMLLLIIPVQILHAILLIWGALENKVLALEISLWLCLILTSYNTVLGLVGSIYFIRNGSIAIHYILATIFILLACCLFSVVFHDIFVVYALLQISKDMQEENIQNDE